MEERNCGGRGSNEISRMRRDIVYKHAKYGNPGNWKTYCKSTRIFHGKFWEFFSSRGGRTLVPLYSGSKQCMKFNKRIGKFGVLMFSEIFGYRIHQQYLFVNKQSPSSIGTRSSQMKEHWKLDEIWRYSKYVSLALVVVAYRKDVTCSIFKIQSYLSVPDEWF